MQACEKCNFYENQNRSSGSCRVNPPIVLKDDNKAVWPVVTVDDWCGRFENKAAWTYANFQSAQAKFVLIGITFKYFYKLVQNPSFLKFSDW